MKKRGILISALAVTLLLAGAVCLFRPFAKDLYTESHQDDMYSAVFEMNGRSVSYGTGTHEIKFKDTNGRLKEFDKAFRRLKLKKLDSDPLEGQKSHTQLSLFFDNAQFIFKTGQTADEKLKAVVSFNVIKPEHSGIYEADRTECAELIELADSLFSYEEYHAEYGTSPVEDIIAKEWEWLAGSTGMNSKDYIIEDKYAQEILTALKSGEYAPVDENALEISEGGHWVCLYSENDFARLEFYTAYCPDHRMLNLLRFEADGRIYSYAADHSIYTSLLFGNGHNLIVDEMLREWKDFSYCECEITLDSETFSIPAEDFHTEDTAARWLKRSFVDCFGAVREFAGQEISPDMVLSFGAETDSGIAYDRVVLARSVYGDHTRYWLKAELENSPDFLEWQESYCYELTESAYTDVIQRAKNIKEVYGNDSGIS